MALHVRLFLNMFNLYSRINVQKDPSIASRNSLVQNFTHWPDTKTLHIGLIPKLYTLAWYQTLNIGLIPKLYTLARYQNFTHWPDTKTLHIGQIPKLYTLARYHNIYLVSLFSGNSDINTVVSRVSKRYSCALCAFCVQSRGGAGRGGANQKTTTQQNTAHS